MPIFIWLVSCLFLFFQFFMQVSGNLLLSSWMQDFQVNAGGASLISAAFFYSYVAMQIPAGILYDRIGVKKVLRIASMVFLLGIVLLALSHSLILAILARFIMGAGAGVAFIGMVYISSMCFPKAHFAMMVGLGEMISMLGVAALEGVVPHWVVNYGWRKIIFALAILALLQCLLIFRYLKDPHVKKADVKKSLWRVVFEGFVLVSKIKNIWYAGFICCGTFGVVSIFAALLGNNFIQVVYQQSYVHASFLISLLLIGVACGGPMIGALNEKHVPYKPLMLGALVLVLISTLLVLSGKLNIATLAVAIFLMGFFGSSYVVSFFVVQESTAPEIRGAGVGLCNAIALLGGMIFQPMTAFILEISAQYFNQVLAFKLAMMVLPMVIAVGIILALLIRLPKAAAVS
jgi:MFS family permease